MTSVGHVSSTHILIGSLNIYKAVTPKRVGFTNILYIKISDLVLFLVQVTHTFTWKLENRLTAGVKINPVSRVIEEKSCFNATQKVQFYEFTINQNVQLSWYIFSSNGFGNILHCGGSPASLEKHLPARPVYRQAWKWQGSAPWRPSRLTAPKEMDRVKHYRCVPLYVKDCSNKESDDCSCSYTVSEDRSIKSSHN